LAQESYIESQFCKIDVRFDSPDGIHSSFFPCGSMHVC